MSDYYPDSYTKKRLAKLEKQIIKVYKKAWREVNKKAVKYFASFTDRYEKEYEAYKAGMYTDTEFNLWVQSQIGRGKRWETLRNELADLITTSNVISADHINAATPSVYSLNHNFEAYVISEVHKNVAFNLIDENTIKRLMRAKQPVVPFSIARINIPKDKRWNMDKLQKALTQGILQGDSVGHMADRFQQVTNMNRNSAITNARTAITSAQNGGRYEAYHEAAQMGIEINKKWRASKDFRTRASHQKLDGETVPYYMAFSNGLMYPGDMTAYIPSEVYNCRCTMVNDDVYSSGEKMRVRNADGQWEVVDEMNYKEWLEWVQK